MNLIQVNFYYSSDALKGYVAVEGENISKAVSYLIPILWGCFFYLAMKYSVIQS